MARTLGHRELHVKILKVIKGYKINGCCLVKSQVCFSLFELKCLFVCGRIKT